MVVVHAFCASVSQGHGSASSNGNKYCMGRARSESPRIRIDSLLHLHHRVRQNSIWIQMAEWVKMLNEHGGHLILEILLK